MMRQPVTSSNIQSIGYDVDSGVLEIEFKGGTVYQYFEVPPQVHGEMLQAGSLGQYFMANIRNKYRYARV